MKLSLDTLKVLAEGGCEKAKDALSQWCSLHLLAPAGKVECIYTAGNDEFNVDIAFEYIPSYKRTIMGMPAVKV